MHTLIIVIISIYYLKFFWHLNLSLNYFSPLCPTTFIIAHSVFFLFRYYLYEYAPYIFEFQYVVCAVYTQLNTGRPMLFNRFMAFLEYPMYISLNSLD